MLLYPALALESFSDAWFLAWIVSPFLGQGLLALLFRRSSLALTAIALTELLLAGFGIDVLYDIRFVHLDPQNGLVAFTLPFLQWLGNVGLLLLILAGWFLIWVFGRSAVRVEQ
jgi:hypothetical protein